MEKKTLNVDSRVSSNLSLLRTFFIFISVLMLIVGLILILVAFVDYDEGYLFTGFRLALCAIGTLFFSLPFSVFITFVIISRFYITILYSNHEKNSMFISYSKLRFYPHDKKRPYKGRFRLICQGQSLHSFLFL